MDETMIELVMEAASAEVFGVWFLNRCSIGILDAGRLCDG